MLDIDKIDEYPLVSQIVKNVLKENNYPVHRINNDLIKKYKNNK